MSWVALHSLVVLVDFLLPFHYQEWSISKFPCSLTRNITSHSMKNLAFHSLLRWKMIILPILTTLGYTVLFIRLGECIAFRRPGKNCWISSSRLDPFYSQAQKVHSPNLPKEKRISEVARIGNIIIFHQSKLWKPKFVILCAVICPVRLQIKFGSDHSWEWKGTIMATLGAGPMRL